MTTTTWSSSAPAPRAQPPPCCSPGPVCGWPARPGHVRQRHPLDPRADAGRGAAADRWGLLPSRGRRGNAGDPAHGVPLADGETVEVALRPTAGSRRSMRRGGCSWTASWSTRPPPRARRCGTRRPSRRCCARGTAWSASVPGTNRGEHRRSGRPSSVGADGVRSTIAARVGAPVVWRGALRRRRPLPLLRRAADHRLRVGLRRRRRRGPDPHQRRAHLRLRGHHTAADARAAQTGRRRSVCDDPG